MYFCYLIALAVLLVILLLLLKEERKFRNSIIQGHANKYWILRERRNFVRFQKEMKIRYNLRDSAPGAEHYSKTTDISSKGLCISSYEKLKEKSFLELEIDIPGFSKPVKSTGEVIWVKELRSADAEGRRIFYTGIRFSEIKPESESMLLTYLNTLKSAS